MNTRCRPRLDTLEGRSLMTAGIADTTFGGTGSVNTPVATAFDQSQAVAVQSNLDVVVLGQGTNTSGSSSTDLVRYNANGTMDTTFGTGGKLKFSFVNSSNAFDYPDSLAIQTDGKIVVVGTTSNYSTGQIWLDIARLNPNGTLDTTFGTGGKVVTPEPSPTDFVPYSVAIQGDGKILLEGGQTSNGAAYPESLELVRYNPNGTLDTSFGKGGQVVNPAFQSPNGQGVAHQGSVAIDSAGRIDVAGYVGTTLPSSKMAVIRYNPNGTPDTTFGSGGMTTVLPPGYAYGQGYSLAIQSTGKIVVAGEGVATGSSRTYSYLVLARFNTDGSLDDGSSRDSTPGDQFGTAGFSIDTQVGVNGWASVVAEADDKLVVLAHAPLAQTTNEHMELARVLADGSDPDPTFGQGGATVVNPGPTSGAQNDTPGNVVIAPDGKFVLTGHLYSPNDLYAARFLTDVAAPTSLAAREAAAAPPLADPALIPMVLEDPSFLDSLAKAKRHTA